MNAIREPPQSVTGGRAAAGAVVVIVAYHSDEWLLKCIETLAQSWNACNEVLIVDNGGNTQLNTCTQLIPAAVIKSPGGLGFAEANNYAFLHGGLTGRYVCLLNQDTLSTPGWLDECIAVMERHPSVGAVMPLLRRFDNQDWDEGFRMCINEAPSILVDAAVNRFCDFYSTRYLTGAAMVIRTDALRLAGPFDPIFGSYYEDFDLCRRIREVGYEVGICGTAVVRHFGGSSTRTTAAEARRARQVLRNRIIMRLREAQDRRLRELASCLHTILRNVLRGIVGTSSSQPLAVQFGAYKDLVCLAPRMLSTTYDRQVWHAYLSQIGWPRAASSAQ